MSFPFGSSGRSMAVKDITKSPVKSNMVYNNDVLLFPCFNVFFNMTQKYFNRTVQNLFHF